MRNARGGNPAPMPTYDMAPLSPVSPVSSPRSPPTTATQQQQQQQFEMQVRGGPPSSYPTPASHAGHSTRSGSAASFASYATAPEGDEDVGVDGRPGYFAADVYAHHQQQPYQQQPYQQQGDHLYGHDPDRRASDMSWDGARAL
jgi:hypothetical protein